LLAQSHNDEQGNRFVLLIRSLDDSQKGQRESLAKTYAELFEQKFGLQVKRLPASRELASLKAEALVINGVNAAPLAQYEAGVHLFYAAQGGLAPVQVDLLRLPEGDELMAIRDFAERLKLRFKQQEGDEASSAMGLPPIIRVYEIEGATLDLRSGLMTLRMPTANELRAFVLSHLPMPYEFEKELN
jgi:hypothetical protein